jgi:predicted RNA polymerase sigma factor
METDGGRHQPSSTSQTHDRHVSALRIVVGLSLLTVAGAGLAIWQAMERRLSKREKARLRFYRYLREKGRLES